MTIVTLGLDLGKNWIHVVALDAEGRIVLRRRVRRDRLLKQTVNMPSCLIGMEACCGAHHLGRALAAQGHTVRLMPPQYVKPFVKSNKNDYRDAEAGAEAVRRPTMRFVPLKSEAQLDLQTIHRVRQRLVGRRTALINQLRAILLERGITVPQGRRVLEARLPAICADEEDRLSPRVRHLIEDLALGSAARLADKARYGPASGQAHGRPGACCENGRRDSPADSGRASRSFG